MDSKSGDFFQTNRVGDISEKVFFNPRTLRFKTLLQQMDSLSFSHTCAWYPMKDDKDIVTDKARLYYEIGALIKVLIYHPDQVKTNPAKGWAIIDTAADASGIDLAAQEFLNLPISKTGEPIGVAGAVGAQVADLHSGYIYLPEIGLGIKSDRIQVHEGLLRMAPQPGFIAIIGRDILRYFKLTFDGITGDCILSGDKANFPQLESAFESRIQSNTI